MSFGSWHQFKLFVEHASGISMDALHILAGFILFLLIAILLRRTLSSALPWIALLLLELVNEAHDLTVEQWPDIGSQLGEGAKDIALTMVIPTFVLLLVRWRPDLITARANKRGA